ncbi:hypothetical protein ACFSCV_07070 [Methylopila henanensis]|uniref:Calcium-binding protein n=1 Tax=Methylopila henanensis TaxID=873516 RepID=A0ABW4K747_9HYPH
MATFTFTTGADTFTGSSGDDLFIADGTTPSLSSQTFQSGDAINGGAGFDTLVVKLAPIFTPDPLYERSVSYTNYARLLQGATSIENLVLTGRTYFVDPSDPPGGPVTRPLTPLDLSAFSGLREVRFESPTLHPFANEDLIGPTSAPRYPGTQASLANVSAAHTIIANGEVEAGLQLDDDGPYTVDLKLAYASSATTARLVYENGAGGDLQLSGAGLTTLAISSDGDDVVAVTPSVAPGAAGALTTLTLDADEDAPIAVRAVEDGAPQFRKITVTGEGGAAVDLSYDASKISFNGSAGDDTVVIDIAFTSATDKFNGGGGNDLMAVRLSGATSLTAAEYGRLNAAAALGFESAGFLTYGASAPAAPLQIDAGLVTLGRLLTASNAAVSNLTDGDVVEVQTRSSGQDAISLTLRHETTASGALSGDGLVTLEGVDRPAFAALLNATGEAAQSRVVIDGASRYARLVVSGDFDLTAAGASLWTDSSGVAHGVRIDAKGLTGDATLQGTVRGDRLRGGSGDDLFLNDAGDDIFDGLGGNDRVSYAAATTAVHIDFGTRGAIQTTSLGVDRLYNIETVIGSSYDDKLAGDDGDNIFAGGPGNDIINGRGGNDTASYAEVTSGGVRVVLSEAGPKNTISAGVDTLISIENLIGTTQNDILGGDEGDNVLDGVSGHDRLVGAGGDDILKIGRGISEVYGGDGDDLVILRDGSVLYLEGVIDGGEGMDTISFVEFTSGAVYELNGNFGVRNVEAAIGSDYGDNILASTAGTRIEGRDGDDVLRGRQGNDTLLGGDGDDRIISGGGDDVLTGGDGADLFQFVVRNSPSNLLVTDFDADEGDSIRLQTGGLPAGALSADAFHVGTAAQDASDRVIYNSVSGSLLFDFDGVGGRDAVQIAILGRDLDLSASDFSIINA